MRAGQTGTRPGSILSVDLASRYYKDIGICHLVTAGPPRHQVNRIEFVDMRRADPPAPSALARELLAMCAAREVTVLLLDGPQGWKAKDNGLVHSRVCERQAATQAKTGEPCSVKPRPSRRFVCFSIETYAELLQQAPGTQLFDGCLGPQLTLVESYPTSAWKALGMRPLPGKRKASGMRVDEYWQWLRCRWPLPQTPRPRTHAQLQALVAGLAGVCLLIHPSCAELLGQPPRVEEGVIVEGYIVNPTLCGLARSTRA